MFVTRGQAFAKSLETLSQLHQDKRPIVVAKFIQLAADLRVATHPEQGRKVCPSETMAAAGPPLHPAGCRSPYALSISRV